MNPFNDQDIPMTQRDDRRLQMQLRYSGLQPWVRYADVPERTKAIMGNKSEEALSALRVPKDPPPAYQEASTSLPSLLSMNAGSSTGTSAAALGGPKILGPMLGSLGVGGLGGALSGAGSLLNGIGNIKRAFTPPAAPAAQQQPTIQTPLWNQRGITRGGM